MDRNLVVLLYAVLGVSFSLVVYFNLWSTAEIVYVWDSMGWFGLISWVVTLHVLHLLFFAVLYSFERVASQIMNLCLFVGWLCSSLVAIYNHEWANGIVCTLFLGTYVDVLMVKSARPSLEDSIRRNPKGVPRVITFCIELLSWWDNVLESIFFDLDGGNGDVDDSSDSERIVVNRRDYENLLNIVQELKNGVATIIEVSSVNEQLILNNHRVMDDQLEVIDRLESELLSVQQKLNSVTKNHNLVVSRLEMNLVNLQGDNRRMRSTIEEQNAVIQSLEVELVEVENVNSDVVQYISSVIGGQNAIIQRLEVELSELEEVKSSAVNRMGGVINQQKEAIRIRDKELVELEGANSDAIKQNNSVISQQNAVIQSLEVNLSQLENSSDMVEHDKATLEIGWNDLAAERHELTVKTQEFENSKRDFNIEVENSEYELDVNRCNLENNSEEFQLVINSNEDQLISKYFAKAVEFSQYRKQVEADLCAKDARIRDLEVEAARIWVVYQDAVNNSWVVHADLKLAVENVNSDAQAVVDSYRLLEDSWVDFEDTNINLEAQTAFVIEVAVKLQVYSLCLEHGMRKWMNDVGDFAEMSSSSGDSLYTLENNDEVLLLSSGSNNMEEC